MPTPSVVAAYRRVYGVAPTLLARAPGRVNLMGEHVDYCGLAVFPMAIQHAITIAARPRADHLVRLHDLDPAFEPQEFPTSRNITPLPSGQWGNYARAAAQAMARRYGALRGLDAVVDSDLPAAAGLSSSSALVVAVALALLAANDVVAEPAELMRLLADGERYVGTAGGGMDQAICLGARAGHAARIEFDPLRLVHTAVPATWRFVVAWSLVRAEKSGAARHAYNDRTHETAEARAMVARRIGVSPEASYSALLAVRTTPELLAAAGGLPHPLGARFRHVITEATRVSRAAAAMEAADLPAFGRLLDASHASLRDDYEVGTPEADRLAAAARGGGAAGARLTGAGFGGCVVAVAEAARAPALLAALRRDFYAPRGLADPPDG
ncbi:MAG TPA: galactokinase, partial [Methylomirabilota bacterium]|nr:galactokinase [Methylomirabilota bacterium]